MALASGVSPAPCCPGPLEELELGTLTERSRCSPGRLNDGLADLWSSQCSPASPGHSPSPGYLVI